MKLLPLLLFLFLLLGSPAVPAADTIRALSVRTTQAPGAGTGSGLSGAALWSPDGGSVVYSSGASDLVPMDFNGAELDVFVRRLGSRSVTLVSVAADGSGSGNGASSFGQFAGSSNRVLFASQASNLVAGDTNGVQDIFVRDLDLGRSRIVSVSPTGALGNATSSSPTITGGRWVIFDSLASNLTASETHGDSHVYLHDLVTGGTELAALGQGGVVGNQATWEGQISEDGRWMTFLSRSTNLVSDFSNQAPDLYLRDRADGTVRQMGLGMVASSLVAGVQRVENYELSADGRFLALVLEGGRYLAGGVTNSAPVAVWYDLVSDVVRFVTEPGIAGATGSIRLAAGGRRVYLDALPAGEVTSRVMAWDETNGLRALEELTLTLPPVQGPCTNSELVEVSSDGEMLVIASSQSFPGVSAGGTLAEISLYEWPVVTGRVRLLTGSADGTAIQSFAMPGAALGPDGVSVLFDSAGALVAGDFNRELDAFLAWRGGGTVELVSARDPGVPLVTAMGTSSVGTRPISDDGRWVLLTSTAPDLVEPAVDGIPTAHLFLRDLEQDRIEWITRPKQGLLPSLGTLSSPVLTRDGSRVFFGSDRGNLVVDDTNSTSDVFLYERATGVVRALSRRLGGAATPGAATFLRAVDGLGRWTLMESTARDLVPEATVGRNVFLHDVENGVTKLISTNPVTPSGGPNLRGFSSGGALSDDGRWAAFLRTTSSTGPAPAAGELIVRHEDGRILRVDPSFTGVSQMALAPDGSLVAYFQSRVGFPVGIRVRRLPSLELVREINLSNSGLRSLAFTPDSRRLLLATSKALVSADTNSTYDVYLVGVVDGQVEWVSSGVAGAVPSGPSDQPSISQDGRMIAFRSSARNVALGDADPGTHVFVRDFAAGLTWRISEPVSSRQGSPASGVALSADGRSAVFQSLGAGIVPGDHNSATDVFQTVLSAPLAADTDSDRLPDAWELWNLGSLAWTGAEDPDGDGGGNLSEFRAGTRPGDPASRLEVFTPAVAADRVTVQWMSVPGLSYQLERAMDLTGPWSVIQTLAASAGGLETGRDVQAERAVYRVRVQGR